MTDTLEMPATAPEAPPPAKAGLLGRFAAQYADIKTPFEVVMPDGSHARFGQGAPTFRVSIKSENGRRALASLDEGRIAEAYLAGDIDLDGDMMKPFELRRSMKDRHFAVE